MAAGGGLRETNSHDFLCTFLKFVFAEQPTCTGDSHYVAALADQVDHDSHHSELIPGVL